ncbi:response regulator [Luteimonas yindakuii]|uniref:Response regulator n=1 Tax=Luteimonas yindakuii TaxID=2565782 RepID=A0A4Z1R8A3_9GAMM|nr:response regulator [Luteimonas yindakuii]QCO67025.1 response regulator [Luteimonas yindakuii]TKS52868.1 response regulator [Luteimonas yindakuii]
MTRARILFVEDEADLRNLIAEVLTDLGFEVTTAADGHEAIAQLEGEPRFDHVISDVSMPNGLSGIDVAAAAARLQAQAKVTLASGYQRAQLPNLPPDVSFLPKPYHVRQLLQVLDAGGA